MKIRTAFLLNTVLSLALLGVAGGLVSLSMHRLRQSLEVVTFGHRIVRAAFVRAVLGDEYLLTREPQALAAWRDVDQDLQELLADAQHRFDRPDTQRILSDLQERNETIRKTRQLLLAEAQRGPEAERTLLDTQRLQARRHQLTLDTQAELTAISRLDVLMRREWSKAQQQAFWLMGGLLLALAGMWALNFVMVRRTVVKPLEQLNRVAKSVGEGVFDMCETVDRSNEIGDLAQQFNRMVGQLQETYTAWKTQLFEYERIQVEQAKSYAALERTQQERLQALEALKQEVEERKALEQRQQSQTAALKQINAELLQQQRVMRSLMEDLQLAKEHMERQANALSAANAKLQEMAAVKDDFVAKVSHELRTPLTSIKEGLNLMLDNALGSTTDEQQDFLRTMDHDIDRLAELINTMLDISKIEAGRMRLARRRVELGDLIDQVMRSNQPLFGHRTVRRTGEQASWVFADTNRLVQVLTNLLSNAIKFTADDGTITFRVTRDDGSVSVAVEDNGPGIAESDLPKLFQKFSQVGSPSPARRGTGLGLVVCQELIGLHQGSIRVTSTVGRGTAFIASLPVYTDALALDESLRELIVAARSEGAPCISLIAVNTVPSAASGGAARPDEPEQLAEALRRHVHRGDVILPLESSWVVVLAITEAKGVRVMVRRLQESVPGASLLRFSAALYPTHGTTAQALFAHATRAIDHGLAALDQAAVAPETTG